MGKLWEYVHRFRTSVPDEEVYDSWDDWLAFRADCDRDMNLIYRFDWRLPAPGLSADEGILAEEHLAIGIVHQRRSNISIHRVRVSRDEEPAIRAWLEKQREYLLTLWSPL